MHQLIINTYIKHLIVLSSYIIKYNIIRILQDKTNWKTKNKFDPPNFKIIGTFFSHLVTHTVTRIIVI